MKVSTEIPSGKVGSFLQRLRDERGLSLAQASKMLGTNGHNLKNIESGKRHIAPSLLVEYVAGLTGWGDNKALEAVIAMVMHI